MIFHKIVRRFVNVYKKNEEKILKKRMKKIGENTTINYPYTVGHPELIEIGDNTLILENARMQVYPENSGVEGNIKIGSHCILNYRVALMAGGNITIGDDVLIASDCCILSENHGFNPSDETPYMDQRLLTSDTFIDDGVWIGAGVTIMPGVHIGKRCVIGAGAVVNHDVPDYCMAVGVPAKVVKTFDFERKEWVPYRKEQTHE